MLVTERTMPIVEAMIRTQPIRIVRSLALLGEGVIAVIVNE